MTDNKVEKLNEDENRQEKLQEIRENLDGKELLASMVKVLDEKQGEEIFVARIDEITTIADYAVVLHARNPRQLKVMWDSVRQLCRGCKAELLNPGELFNDEWTVLDYGTVIIHLMSSTARAKYRLEEMWSKGEVIDVQSLLPEEPCNT
jgi:ribosome-associated protein